MLVITFFGYRYLKNLLNKFLDVSQVFMQIMTEYKSKLISIYLQALTGSVHLRIHQKQNFLDKKFYEINDNFQRSMSHFGNYSQRWFRIRLMYFNVTFLLFALVTPLCIKVFFADFFLSNTWHLSVAITWSFKLVNHLNSFILYFTSTLNYVTSISRAYEYIDGIPTEFRIEDEDERTKRLDNILNKNKLLIEKMGE